jgi:hypothetical protein
VTEIMDGIPVEESRAVIRSWIERVQNIIDVNEDYVSD